MKGFNMIDTNPLVIFNWIADLITGLGAVTKKAIQVYIIGFDVPIAYPHTMYFTVLGSILLAFLICSFFTRSRRCN